MIVETPGVVKQENGNPNRFYELYGRTIAEQGVAPIPTALFRYQRELGLSFQEVAFICHLLSYRWTVKDPYPSIRELSKLTGVSEKTLHSYKKSLVEKGLIVVRNRYDSSNGQLSNEYDLTPVFEKLQQIIQSETSDSGQGCVKNTDPPLTRVDHAGGCEKISHPPLSEFQRGVCKNFTPPLTMGSDELNNNIFVVVDVDHDTDDYQKPGDNVPADNHGKMQDDPVTGTHPPLNAAVLGELQAAVLVATGARVPSEFLEELLLEFPKEKIREKIKLISEMGSGTEIRNVPGLLVAALREDYRHEPGRPQGRVEKNKSKTKQAESKTDSEEHEKLRKRELLKSLYLS
ncbi:helix-turn-helix domain-containing protein [Desulfofundulus thermocisternus]|uniref:helix-turn-helix domain-containing protein n=1 Tax=Desulfofundulus thermocisternus TaxID=42471 RepID=UPI00217DBD78|nr:helix-turn-helix domain-containing protein [Desulfofundulus thermocisternus]MCS5697155.1 helix-turn-helix domain-containing protein [Desulfofundulus thermocisternus]